MSKEKINPRIIAGQYKGMKLQVPESARPFTERIKIIIFDILGDRIKDARCADLFAGSGNMGIESLSRGAANVVFVDSSVQASEIIKNNLTKLAVPAEKYKVYKMFFETYLNRTSDEAFDLIFLDPPFSYSKRFNIDRLIKVCHEDTIVILKVPAKNFHVTEFEKYRILYSKVYGSNKIFFLTPQ